MRRWFLSGGRLVTVKDEWAPSSATFAAHIQGRPRSNTEWTVVKQAAPLVDEQERSARRDVSVPSVSLPVRLGQVV